jgi:2-hydroxychromene-2-carboxylate isomerase
MSVRDRLQRRVIPRLIVAASTVDRHHRLAAALRRRLGRRGRVVLFVAFDDASSAVATVGLSARLAGRDVDLVVEPVLARGIPGDPAAVAKRSYAVTDARRLARRDGIDLGRTAPLDPEATAFLAWWASAIPDAESRAAFSAAAMRALWFDGNGPVEPQRFEEIWREAVGTEPPARITDEALAGERRMRRRRLYDTPVAVVGGRWFFAHERLDQIEARLDGLGWRRAG